MTIKTEIKFADAFEAARAWRDAYDDALARISDRLTQIRSELSGGSQ